MKTPDNGKSHGPSQWHWTALLLVIGLLVIVRHWPWSVFGGGDQAKQAFASLEMVSEGAWFFQRLPTGRPATKPPLMAWLSAGLRLAGAPWPIAWRLPSLWAFGVVAVWLVRRAARVAGGWGAWITLAFFALNMMTIKLAAMIRTDMLLAGWIVAAAGLVGDHVASGQPWGWRDRTLFSALIAAALFTKGPVVFAFLPPALLTWQYAHRHATRASGLGISAWAIPSLLFLAWVAAGILWDSDFHRWVVRREFGNNFVVDAARSGPLPVRALYSLSSILTYPAQLLHRLFPWSVALVAWALTDRDGRRRLWADTSARWWAIWLFASLVVMSLVPDKRADRVFPLVPPMALLSAYAVRYQTRYLQPDALGRWIGVLTVVAVLIWGPYTVLRMRQNGAGTEGARREFGERVREWAAAEGCPVVLAGPVDESDQSLPLHLRVSRWIPFEEIGEALARGAVVVAPEDRLLAAGAVEILFRQEPADGTVTRYALGLSLIHI